MSNELKVYRFAPDQPGRGGQTDGLNSFMRIEDTRTVEGFRPYRRMWRRDGAATTVFVNAASPRYMSAFTLWRYYSSTFSSILQKAIFAWWAPVGVTQVWYAYGTGGLICSDSHSYSTAPPLPSLCPVNDRLIIGTGVGYPRVWDGTTVLGVPQNVYPLGCPSPSIAPTVSVSYNFTSGDYYYTAAGSYTIAIPELTTNPSFDGLLPGEEVRVYHETLSSPDYVTRRVVRRESGTTFGSAPTEGPFPLPAPAWLNGTAGAGVIYVTCNPPGNADGTSPQLIGLAFKVGSTLYPIGKWEYDSPDMSRVTFVTGTLPAGYSNVVPAGGWSNLSTWDLQGVRVTLDDVTPGVSDAWETTGRVISRPAPGTGYTAWTGAEAPGYAYAYYDPVSGHISNLSPVTYLENTNVVNGKIEIDIAQNSGVLCANGDTPVSGTQTATGIQYIGEWNSIEVARFSKILWFRTRRSGGGAVLYPIGSLDPASSAWAGWYGSPGYSAGTYTDDSTDADLIISGRISAPLQENYRPRIVNHLGAEQRIIPTGIDWWDGRVWMYGPPDIGALHYSCDNAQCGMGRPEESFPDTNRLVVPAGDGEITSILTVGEYLLVNTQRYSYVVQGNHESNYRLVRIAAELGGVNRDSICEIPMGSQSQATVAAITRDCRVIILPLGGEMQDIGSPIAPWLRGGKGHIAFYRSFEHSRLAVRVDGGTPGADKVFEYNFEHRIWTRNTPTLTDTTSLVPQFMSSVTTNAAQGYPTSTDRDSFLIYGVGNTLYWTPPSPSGARPGGSLSTWTLPADSAKRRYSFAWARIVLTGDTASATPPTLLVYANESQDKVWVYPMAAHSDVARRLYPANDGTWSLDGGGREFVCFGAGASVLRDMAPGGGSYTESAYDGSLPLGYRLNFSLSFSNSDLNLYSIAFVEIAIREESEDGSLEP